MTRRSTGPGEATKHAPVSHVALMRGINVGGKNKISMTDLAAVFADSGCGNVRTYIQSGNVLFKASNAVASRLPSVVAAAINQRFGFSPPVVVRTVAEIRSAAASNPFPGDAEALYVGFLAEQPAAARIAALDPDRSPGDTFVLRGREIYMLLRTGAAKTKLTTAYFDATLKTVSTFRNWRTVCALAELTRNG